MFGWEVLAGTEKTIVVVVFFFYIKKKFFGLWLWVAIKTVTTAGLPA